MFTIYLAGPMEALSKDEQKGWRNEAIQFFKIMDDQVTILDPTRRKHEDDMTAKEIFLLDLKDVDDADLILVDSRNINNAPVFGTPCECFYASYIQRKPVISWYNQEYPITKSKRVFQNALFSHEFDSLQKALWHIRDNYVN